jgi:hypothetical protein
VNRIHHQKSTPNECELRRIFDSAQDFSISHTIAFVASVGLVISRVRTGKVAEKMKYQLSIWPVHISPKIQYPSTVILGTRRPSRRESKSINPPRKSRGLVHNQIIHDFLSMHAMFNEARSKEIIWHILSDRGYE